MSYNDPRSRSLPWMGSLTAAARDIARKTGHSAEGLLALMRAHATTPECDTLACIPYEHRAALIRWLQAVEPRKPLPKLPWLPEVIVEVVAEPVKPPKPEPEPKPAKAPAPVTQAPGAYRLHAIQPLADGIALTVTISYDALPLWMRQAEGGTTVVSE